MLKRLSDLVLTITTLPLWLPALGFIAILVRFKLGKPILFRQRRPGYQQKCFTLLKFRTMTNERDSSGKLLPDAFRLTRFGRWLRSSSLDELPELFNVLAGNMSLVGPRPLLEKYLPLYSTRQARRHEVVPGITGWAQINGRNALSWEEKFELDVWYVENRSWLLDFHIMLITLWRVIARTDISAAGEATMPEFRGSNSRKDPASDPCQLRQERT